MPLALKHMVTMLRRATTNRATRGNNPKNASRFTETLVEHTKRSTSANIRKDTSMPPETLMAQMAGSALSAATEKE